MNARHFLKKRGRFSKKRWTFSKKRRSFFQSLPREDFSQQIGTQKKAGNGRATSLKVQPLTARIDNFQA